MLEGAGEVFALFGIVAQPVEELGPTPLGGVDAAAPIDGGKALAARGLGDLGGLGGGASSSGDISAATGMTLEPVVSSAMASIWSP
jgi:hypothetical protein